MTPEARAMLDQIDEFLSKEDKPASELAAVLTALRGPDSNNMLDKENMTIPIRRAALPRTWANGTKVRVGGNEHNRWMVRYMAFGSKVFNLRTTISATEIRDLLNDHWGQHIYLAAEALGILENDTYGKPATDSTPYTTPEKEKK